MALTEQKKRSSRLWQRAQWRNNLSYREMKNENQRNWRTTSRGRKISARIANRWYHRWKKKGWHQSSSKKNCVECGKPTRWRTSHIHPLTGKKVIFPSCRECQFEKVGRTLIQ